MQNNRNYTKGDCYALCEMLESLYYNKAAIGAIATAYGYESDYLFDLIKRLHNGVDSVIGQEQDQRDDTDEMAEIMKLQHVQGHKE